MTSSIKVLDTRSLPDVTPIVLHAEKTFALTLRSSGAEAQYISFRDSHFITNVFGSQITIPGISTLILD